MCNSSSRRSYVQKFNWEWWCYLNFAVYLQQSNAQSKIGNSLSQQVEICTADITPILLLNHALCACKILGHLSLFDVLQAQYRFLYTDSNCFVLERFLVSMFNVQMIEHTSVTTIAQVNISMSVLFEPVTLRTMEKNEFCDWIQNHQKNWCHQEGEISENLKV